MAPQALPQLSPEALVATQDLLHWMQQVATTIDEIRSTGQRPPRRYDAVAQAVDWLNAALALSSIDASAGDKQQRPAAAIETKKPFHMTLIKGGKA